jgi:hypothetical protein
LLAAKACQKVRPNGTTCAYRCGGNVNYLPANAGTHIACDLSSLRGPLADAVRQP